MQKALGWIGLAIGVGGTFLYAYAKIGANWPEVWALGVMIWPLGYLLLALGSGWALWRAYRREPVPGRHQVVLADLLVTLVVFSSVLYVSSYAHQGVELIRLWALPALAIAGCYLAGVSRAAWLGFRGWRRYAVGVTTAAVILGSLGLAMLVVAMTQMAFQEGADSCVRLISRLLGAPSRGLFEPNCVFYALRAALCLLPVGLILSLALRLLAPKPPGRPLKSSPDCDENT